MRDPGDWKVSSDFLGFSKLSSAEADKLELPFSEEEVGAALKDLNGDKAPGSDGLTAAFWQFNWGTVKGEVMRVFRDLYYPGKFIESLNSTFVLMIPKKEGEIISRTTRPIGLVSSLYKLITKVLDNRIKQACFISLVSR